MAMKLADAGATSGEIERSGSKNVINGQTVSLEGSMTKVQGYEGAGLIELRLSVEAVAWPDELRPSAVAFRPQTGGYYFNYINFEKDGAVTRVTRSSASNVRIQKAANVLKIQFEAHLRQEKAYEAGVYLVDEKGVRHSLGVQSLNLR